MPRSFPFMRRVTLPAVLALSLAGTSAAVAIDRHAAPLGAGTGCSLLMPCAISEAFSAAEAGDTIMLRAGTYDVATTLELAVSGVRVTGVSVADKPQIRYVGPASAGVLSVTGTNVLIRDVTVTGTSDEVVGVPFSYLVSLGSGAILERVKIVNTGSASTLLAPAATVRDSVIASRTGVAAALSGTVTGSTLVCDPTSSCSALAQDDDRLGAGVHVLSVRNTILRGGDADIVNRAALGSSVTLAVDSSALRPGGITSSGAGSHTEFVGSTNVGPATLVTPADGADVRQSSGSSSINAGSDAAVGISLVDFDGQPRIANGVVDIGADELNPITHAAAANGTPGAACTTIDPCTLLEAVAGAGPGDTIQLAAGTYTLTSALLNPSSHLTVIGAPAPSLSRIVHTVPGATQALAFGGANVTVQDIEATAAVDDDGTARYVATLGPDATLERVRLINTGSGGTLFARDATVRNSVVSARGGTALVMNGLVTQSTILCGQATSCAALSLDEGRLGIGTRTVTVRNSILRGGSADVFLQANDPASLYTVDLDSSSYRGGAIPGAGQSRVQILGANNVTAPPLLAHAADAGDIHQLEGSPTIDAGGTDLATTADIEGDDREAGGRPDIGADETGAPFPAPQQATEVTASGATLRAAVMPNYQTSFYGFEYGPTTAYGSTTGPRQLPAASQHSAVAEPIAGLPANTTIHYRVIASNASGVRSSVDETFTTLPNAPSVLTGSVTDPTTSALTLTATVDPQSVATTWWFEYGPTAGYGQTSPHVVIPAGSGAAVPVSADIAGLAAGGTVHYRVVAANAGGTTSGADRVGTTVALVSPPAVNPVTPDPVPAVGALRVPVTLRSGRALRLRFSLSERASVTVVIGRVGTGFRTGGACRDVPAGRVRCATFQVRAARTAVRDASAASTVTLPALLGGRPLTPGTYRVKVFATDLVTGTRSPVTTVVVVIAE